MSVSDMQSIDTKRDQAIRDLVTRAGKLEANAEENDTIVRTEFLYSQSGVPYTVEQRSKVILPKSITKLDRKNDAILWPGNLLRGDNVQAFSYHQIGVRRAPLTISISLESSPGAGKISRTVVDPKLSTMREGIKDLLNGAFNPGVKTSADATFLKKEVHSEAELSAFLSADVKYGPAELKGSVDWKSKTAATRIAAVYRQVYYTINIDMPNSPADLLDPQESLAVLEAAMPPGSLPLYVSSVDYGMMAVLLIESNSSFTEIKAALDASCDAGTGSASVAARTAAKKTLQDSSINIIVYGGSTLGLNDLEKGYEGFKKVIEASRTFGADSPGAPLSFSLMRLADNDPAPISMVFPYTVSRPVKVRVTVDRFVCELSDDEGSKNKADMLKLKFFVKALNRKDDRDPGDLITTNGKESEAEIVYSKEWEKDRLWTVGIGSEHKPPQDQKHSTILEFDTGAHDFDRAHLELWGWGEEYDTTSKNDKGDGGMLLEGEKFFNKIPGELGEHNFTIECSDFRFRIDVTLERVS